jgi:MFS family permease
MTTHLALAPEEPDATTPLLAAKTDLTSTEDDASIPSIVSRSFLLILLVTALPLLGTTVHSVSDLALARYIYCYEKYPDAGQLPNMLVKQQHCFDRDISQKVAVLMGLLPMVEGIPNTILVLFWGRFSDTWGRRPVFFMVALGGLVQLLSMIATAVWFPVIGIWPMYFGAVFSGLCGSGPALKTALWCYIVETVPESARLIAFSWITALTYGTFVVGPLLGTWLLQFGLSIPLWFGTILFALEISVVYFLPESLKRPEVEEDAEHPSYIQIIKESVLGLKLLFSRRTAFILGFVVFCWDFTTGEMVVYVQHLINYFGWSVSEGASFYSAFALAKVTTFVFVVPAMTKFFQSRVRDFNYKLLKYGILGYCIANICYALLRNTHFLPLVVALQALSSPFTVATRVFIAELAPPAEIGRVFAAMSLVEGVGDLSGPAVWNGIYAALLGRSKEASSLVFLGVAIVYMAAHISVYFMKRGSRFPIDEA